MGFKLVISNKVLTKVKGFYRDEKGVARPFNFELEQDRISQEELKDLVTDGGSTPDFIRRVTHGWKGQRLVLGDDDQPAEFCGEALDVLLSISGMATYCYQAYVAQVLVTEKN
jgi:hypothetical protein